LPRITLVALVLAGLAALTWSLKAPTETQAVATPGGVVSPEPAARAAATAEAGDSSPQPPPQRGSTPPGGLARQASPDRRASSPEAACAGLNYFALAMCISRECQNPRWRAHPQCLARAMEERRQRDPY
jgi:hypothetical protein